MAKRANSEGTVYQRKDGRWTAAVTLGTGKRKQLYGPTRRDVAEKLVRLQRDQQLGIEPGDDRLFVRDYLKRWLAASKATVRPRTYDSYVLNVARAHDHIGAHRLAALKPIHVQTCYAALLGRGLSARSVAQCHAVLHRAFRQAVNWGLIARNPTDAVAAPRAERREMRALTEADARALFAVTSGDRDHALWVVLVTAGLRLGEALGCRWDDLDLTAGTLAIRRALQWQTGAGLVFVEPKTKRSRRTVHLAPGTVAALREHKKILAAERLASGGAWEDPTLLFPNPAGAPTDPTRVPSRLKLALTKAKLPAVRVHDLRHSCASILFARGVHPKLVQELLGHSTVGITLDLYSHTIPAMHGEAASQMQGLFSKQRARVDDAI